MFGANLGGLERIWGVWGFFPQNSGAPPRWRCWAAGALPIVWGKFWGVQGGLTALRHLLAAGGAGEVRGIGAESGVTARWGHCRGRAGDVREGKPKIFLSVYPWSI